MSAPARPLVLAVVAAGGVIGAEARFAIGQLWSAPDGFPWATLTINATGCLLIGALVAVLVARATHPLVRPFAAVGVLGGYTTFSSYTVDTVRLLTDGRPVAAASYAVVTLVVALLAVLAGAALAGLALGGSDGRGAPGRDPVDDA